MAAEQATALAANAIDSLPEGALAAKLRLAQKEDRPLRVKLGIDPTAPDIHLGHAVVLGKLREFQDAGHRVVLIVGDYTARVGDPSGRSSLRPMLSGEEIETNAATFQEQALKILDSDPERLEVRRNGEWLDMALTELLALVRTTTVAQLLERDDFAKRMSASEPISMLELLYPLLQGYDSVAVEADVELGGTDQKFNLLLGRDIQRAYGKPEQAIMTMPILVGTDGKRKMSKSLGNQIGVTDSPEEMYGKTLSIPDEAMDEYYRLLLKRPPPHERPAGGEQADDDELAGLSPRDAKRALARALVTWLHSAEDAEAAERELRAGVRRARRTRGDRGGDVPGRPRGPGASTRTDRRGVRDLALGGPAADRPGRRDARRYSASHRRARRFHRARRRAGAQSRQAPVPAAASGLIGAG